MAWRRRSLESRQRFVASYVLPPNLGRDLTVRYAHIETLGPAQRGLRQWLRLHILEPRFLAMPSRAVDLLWHEFVDNEEYEHFCKQAYGRFLHHQPRGLLGPEEARSLDGEALAATYAMACRDVGLPRYSQKMPMLFSADATLGLGDGQIWTLNCGHARCATSSGARCITHDLLPLIPNDLPRQVVYRPDAAVPSSSFALSGGGTSYTTPGGLGGHGGACHGGSGHSGSGHGGCGGGHGH